MIRYDAGSYGVHPKFVFKVSGSVVLRALLWAIPCGLLGVGLWFFWNWWDNSSYGDGRSDDVDTVSKMLSGYSFILGFMVVFRMQIAYNRYWDAAIETHELRATWFSAASSLCAFVTDDQSKQADVQYFQNYLVRLVSMMHSAACERLDGRPIIEYTIMDNVGMDKGSLEYLAKSSDRVEVIEQWIERLVVKNMGNGVLPIPPPVIARVFNDLSGGIIDLGHLEVVSDNQLPFPFAQCTALLLLFHFMLTPLIASLIMYTWRWAGTLAFTSTFALWSINYIAMEIEMPFADHKNNLPGTEMQDEMNRALNMLLQKPMQKVPHFDFEDYDAPIGFTKKKMDSSEAAIKKELSGGKT